MAEKAKKEEKFITHTYEGIEISIGVEQVDDIDLFEDLVAAKEGDELRIVPVMRHLLGDKYADVKEAIKKKCGRVSVQEMTALFEALFAKVGEENPN